MGVFKRKRKYWIDYYDSQRNRIQESSHSSSKRDAEDLLALRKTEILRGTFRRPVKITFGELGNKYMEYAKANKSGNRFFCHGRRSVRPTRSPRPTPDDSKRRSNRPAGRARSEAWARSDRRQSSDAVRAASCNSHTLRVNPSLNRE